MLKYVVAAMLAGASSVAWAGQLEVGLYGGANNVMATPSTISKNGKTYQLDPPWSGKSFDAPIYYGVRATYWSDMLPNWGFGIDFTHTKAYADLTDPSVAGKFTTLEFTDGVNQLTADAFYKWDFDNGFHPYVGAGVGAIIPHVEIVTTAANPIGVSSTLEYQVTGPVVQGLAGVSFDITHNIHVFAEYKAAYQWNNASLVGGGTFSNSFLTNQVLAGISFSLDAGDL
jgi:lipid A oxidase